MTTASLLSDLKTRTVDKMNAYNSDHAGDVAEINGKSIICRVRCDRNPGSTAKHLNFSWTVNGKKVKAENLQKTIED